MVARLTVAFFLLSFSCGVNGQDNVGAGHALRFDGVDDYISLGNIYDDLKLPLTISAWIFLDPGGLGTIFSSQESSTLYSGFHFYVIHNAMIIEYGDGLGPYFSPDYRRGKEGSVENIFGRWVQVTAIMRGASDMDLYLNGVDIGGTYIGNSQFPMESSVPLDTAKIGYRSSTGVTYHFQGIMDELRIWNRSLSEDEIREQMCRKLSGNEPGLIGYWDFDGTNVLTDRSPNHFDGQVKGNPIRVYSGAPIGNKSVLLYTNDWKAKVLTLQEGLDKVRVANVTGNPNGLHAYEVTAFPSQAGGLNSSTVSKPYFGIFTASTEVGNFFDVCYTHEDSAVCKVFTRSDNSTPFWNENPSMVTRVFERSELIKELSDTTLKIDLGPDEAPCTFSNPRIVMPLKDTTGFEFLWQDGSTGSSYLVSDFGSYWLIVNDGCNRATDTLTIYKVGVDNLSIPNVFTPNGDSLNQFFEIDQRMAGSLLVICNRLGDEVYRSASYHNDWDGADLPAGVYFYRLVGGYCIDEKRGTLSIVR